MSQLLSLSIEKHASDIHIQPNLRPLFRIDGILSEVKDYEILSADEAQNVIFSVMTRAEQDDFQKKYFLELALAITGVGNFRVSVFHQLKGIAAVFRVIPAKIPSFEVLGLPPVLKTLMVLQHGLILLTGPTGSGKSTTLASMIDYVNAFRACNIITIEDPIEFTYVRQRAVFNQLQVGRDTPDFATALRAALRQDPNVILIGELRDLETMRLALRAAETGHLIFATLHASTSAIAVNRFIDVFPSREKNMVRNLLSETLQAVICQTLVKKITGGRIGAFEVMLATPAIRRFIREDKISHMESAMQISGDKGMFTLEQYLAELVSKKIIHQNVANTLIASRGTFKSIAIDKAKNKENK